jgi:hypothetical protein
MPKLAEAFTGSQRDESGSPHEFRTLDADIAARSKANNIYRLPIRSNSSLIAASDPFPNMSRDRQGLRSAAAFQKLDTQQGDARVMPSTERILGSANGVGPCIQRPVTSGNLPHRDWRGIFLRGRERGYDYLWALPSGSSRPSR